MNVDLTGFLVEAMKRGGELEAAKARIQNVAVDGAPDLRLLVLGSDQTEVVVSQDKEQFSISSFQGLNDLFVLCRTRKLETTVKIKSVVETLCSTPEGAAVACDVTGELMGIEEVFGSQIPRCFAITQGRLSFEFSANAKKIRTLVAFGQAREFAPPAFVDFLSRQLGGLVPRETIAPFRRIDFQSLTKGVSVAERGKSEFGRQVESIVQKADAIPEFITVEFQPFVGLPWKSRVRINVDLQPENGSIVPWIATSDWESIAIELQSKIASAIRSEVDSVFMAEDAEKESPPASSHLTVVDCS